MRRGPEVVAVLQGYFDASFTDGGGISTIAGYVGTTEQWQATEKSWIANLAYWEIDDFHLCDLVAKYGFGKTGLMVSTFAHIMRESGLRGFTAGLVDGDWEALEPDKANHPTRYHTCAAMLFRSLKIHVPLYYEGEALAVVMDEDVKPQSAVQGIFEGYREGGPLSDLTFSNRKSTVAIQCADLIAGISRRDTMAFGFARINWTPEALTAFVNLANQTIGVFLSEEGAEMVRQSEAAIARRDAGRA